MSAAPEHGEPQVPTGGSSFAATTVVHSSAPTPRPTLLSPRVLWWAMVICVLAWLVRYALYPNVLFSVGVNHLGAWFLDAYAILASNDALALGRDPYLANALDVFHRPHVYSQWWLHLHELGLTRAHTPWLGLAFGGSFVAAALAYLRPRHWRELLWYFVVLFSSCWRRWCPA